MTTKTQDRARSLSSSARRPLSERGLPATGRWRFRLRTILLLINLLVLVLPLAGIAVLRIYESALIRQTESELVAQGAFISSTYQALYARLAAGRDPRGRAASVPDAPASGYGTPVDYLSPPRDPEGPWRPRPLQLDLAGDAVLPPPPEPDAPDSPSDALALAIGRELEPILRTAQYTTLAGMRVVDFRGTIVASTFQDERTRSLLGFQEIVRALRGEPVSVLRERSGNAPPPPLESISRGAHVRVFVAVPIIRGDRVLGAVLLVRTPANIKQALLGKRSALIRGVLLLVALVLALSLLTSLTISRPVRALIEQTRRAARGERGAIVPLKSPGTQEIGELSETIAAMAATLESRANYIRDFAAHVSHEFKTPLTAIQGSVELLREHGGTMSSDERNRFLGILSDDAERLERLVRRLLELARADMSHPGDERAPLHATLETIANRFREAGLHIATDLAIDSGVQAAMAAETLDAVIGTVLDNTRQHAGANVSVQLHAAMDPTPGFACIDLVDNGCGITPANALKIFEPFFTTARHRGSTGLGLSIVRSLLAAHGGDVTLITNDAGGGAHFRIRLPLAAASLFPNLAPHPEP